MKEREKQLILALLDCAGVYYDINYTKNRILGTPIQIVNGKEYPILELIGKPENCTHTEIVDYWAEKMPESEREGFRSFSDIERVKARYSSGERLISHSFWTFDVLGNRMLAEQKVRLYEDITNGDVLGLVYVSNGSDKEAREIKEALLREQAKAASMRVDFLETMGINIPGGYHRCGTGDGFALDFVSDSFTDIVGWTREEIKNELDNKFINIVAPEDREFFMSHEPALVKDGEISVAYRIMRRDGTRRWVQDSTMHVEKDGMEYYQCILADITDFVNERDAILKSNLELTAEKNLFRIMEENMPSGYHRCKAEPGCPFIYIGDQFCDIVGYTKEEIEKEFDNKYHNLVWDEDVSVMSTFEDMLAMRGKGNNYSSSVYRMKHKDGGYRWITDSTMFVDLGENSFFQGTVTDITEHIESLNEAKRRAETSNLAKSTFLFNASHDIRTPMNAIQGFAHIIEENANDPETVSAAVKKIKQASDTLMSLMNDILDLARIERGKEEVNEEAVYLAEHSNNLYEMFAEAMERAGISFKREMDIEHAHVYLDPLKMSRIGMNMLSNAKKFTPFGGSVVFGIRELSFDGDRAEYIFFVRDTGIGMSEEFRRRAFEQFERERSSTESGVSGSGLGLAIIKKLAELMGGTVEIKSKLGAGTEISFRISLRVMKDDEITVTEDKLVELDMSGKRVLLVEDNSFNREIARYILESVGFETDDAENGSVCVNKLLEHGSGYYDLVLMDIQMPVMDGYSATREIRSMSDSSLSKIPIIAMTANAFEEDKQRCLAYGMNGHIGKPIDIDMLFSELKKLF